MSIRVTRREIIEAIGCPNLSLVKSTYPMRQPYFYFRYDFRGRMSWPCVDGVLTRPKDKRIDVAQLNHMTLDAWASLGLAFVKEAEATT